jgi:hypothetical protein
MKFLYKQFLIKKSNKFNKITPFVDESIIRKKLTILRNILKKWLNTLVKQKTSIDFKIRNAKDFINEIKYQFI